MVANSIRHPMLKSGSQTDNLRDAQKEPSLGSCVAHRGWTNKAYNLQSPNCSSLCTCPHVLSKFGLSEWYQEFLWSPWLQNKGLILSSFLSAPSPMKQPASPTELNNIPQSRSHSPPLCHLHDFILLLQQWVFQLSMCWGCGEPQSFP